MSGIVKKSINLSGHLTSISLEPEFWSALKDISERESSSIRSLVQKVDHDRINSDSIYNLSSAIRVFILSYYKERISIPFKN